MKKLITLTCIVALASCVSPVKKSDRNITIGDTITTKSGLKYVFLKEGNGKKVEPGSKVKVFTDLYLNDADTVFWTTSTAKDSTFTFIHQKTSLIKGFTELYNYLNEGDEVIAILPDSLAYGKSGRGPVPPNATLVYNPIVVKYVSEPKEVMNDTLIAILKNQSVDEAIQFFEDAVAGKHEIAYHSDMSSMVDVVMEFSEDSLFVKLEKVSDYLLSKSSDEDATQSFYYGKIMALENQGKINEALTIAKQLAEKKLNKQYWTSVVKTLEQKVNE